MIEIPVRTSRSYTVKLAPGLLDRLGEETAPLVRGRTATLISDSNVSPLYADRVKVSLEKAGFRVCSCIIPAGENYKNGMSYLALLEFLAEQQMTRSDCLIALGGGVIGDLTGFTAATYLRGIDFIQVPTTLLAAVDASVGGKTAIDLKAGKNLAGAFYQPKGVFFDPDTLKTLPPDIFSDGCAEVIKYGMIGDAALLDDLAQGIVTTDIIARCIAQKRDYVEQDEFDTGVRQFLNLGHTFGHGIEGCSHYQISHGKAVSIGMVLAARCAIAAGLCPVSVLPRLIALLEKYDLPTETDYSTEELLAKMLSDKKRTGDEIALILPIDWGASIRKILPVSELKHWMERGHCL